MTRPRRKHSANLTKTIAFSANHETPERVEGAENVFIDDNEAVSSGPTDSTGRTPSGDFGVDVDGGTSVTVVVVVVKVLDGGGGFVEGCDSNDDGSADLSVK
ncbi:hypothetical protein ACTXT7_012085 [Hymenolepis weldensis]